MMVGMEGFGKTTYANDRLPNHTRVSLDINRSLLRDERLGLMDRYGQENPLGLERQPASMPPIPWTKGTPSP